MSEGTNVFFTEDGNPVSVEQMKEIILASLDDNEDQADAMEFFIQAAVEADEADEAEAPEQDAEEPQGFISLDLAKIPGAVEGQTIYVLEDGELVAKTIMAPVGEGLVVGMAEPAEKKAWWGAGDKVEVAVAVPMESEEEKGGFVKPKLRQRYHPAPAPTCKYFAPNRYLEGGVEPPEDWPFDSLFTYNGCMCPALNAQGITACQFSEQQNSCESYEASEVQILSRHRYTKTQRRGMPGEVVEVTVRQGRTHYGTAVQEVLVRNVLGDGEKERVGSALLLQQSVLAQCSEQDLITRYETAVDKFLENFGPYDAEELPVPEPDAPEPKRVYLKVLAS